MALALLLLLQRYCQSKAKFIFLNIDTFLIGPTILCPNSVLVQDRIMISGTEVNWDLQDLYLTVSSLLASYSTLLSEAKNSFLVMILELVIYSCLIDIRKTIPRTPDRHPPDLYFFFVRTPIPRTPDRNPSDTNITFMYFLC